MGRSRYRRRFAPLDRQSPSDEFSQDACFLEAEVAGASFGRRANDDVIEQLNLQKLGGFGQTPRQAVIGLTRRRIAGGMIVHDNHCVGRRHYRWMKNLTRMRDAFVSTSQRHLFDADEMITSVEQDHAQRFLAQHAHFCANQLIYNFGRIDLLLRQCLAREAPAKIKSGRQLHCFGEPNAVDFCKLIDGASASAKSASAYGFAAIPSSTVCASRIKSLPAAIDSLSAPLVAPILRSSVISSILSSSTSRQQRSRSKSEADRKKINTGRVNLPLRRSVPSVLPVALSLPARSRQAS